MVSKSWTLTINNRPLTLTLAPPNQRGICWKCQLEKEISVISERKTDNLLELRETRKFCQSCSLANLYELETINYEVAKEIKEILKQKTEQIELW